MVHCGISLYSIQKRCPHFRGCFYTLLYVTGTMHGVVILKEMSSFWGCLHRGISLYRCVGGECVFALAYYIHAGCNALHLPSDLNMLIEVLALANNYSAFLCSLGKLKRVAARRTLLRKPRSQSDGSRSKVPLPSNSDPSPQRTLTPKTRRKP